MDLGPEPAGDVILPEPNRAGSEIGKYTIFDVPPPGLGFITATDAVLGVATSHLWIFADNVVLLTNVVKRRSPFHVTTEWRAKPVPVTVSVNPSPPGVIVSGVRGW
jgi:hypothetical protein